MKQKLLIIFFGFLALNLSLLIGCSSLKASNPSSSKAAYIQSKEVVQPRTSVETQQLHYGVSTQGFHTTKASEKILSEGGNLIDAFVAASFMISVERPHSTGIGGGGFFLFHEGSTGKVHAVDFRERAPGLAHKNLFLDAQGNYLSTLSKEGALSVATPGLVLGLWEIHKKFGKQPWKKLLEPSIQLADQGFEVYETLAAALKNKKNLIESNMAAQKIFLKPNLEPYSVGDVLYQKDLAKTLKRIAQKGALDFYQGQLAHQMIKSLQQKNGIISPQDLKNYTVKWRTPVVGSFLDYQIYSMPPPSSGGIHILQFLNFLEREPWTPSDLNQAHTLHLQAAALQSAFADRATYLGDPDFFKIPQDQLLSKFYASQRRSEVPKNKARKAEEVFAGNISSDHESFETTHMSLMDDQGNAIASTQSINGWMGSGHVIEGTGIVMNNEMDDFSAKPGASNLFGAVGGLANSIAPYKTPLSSMSPTLVLDEKKIPVLSLGAPGGTRIISCTAQTLFNHLFFKLPLWESVSNIRYHHQWKPDVLSLEIPGPDPMELKKLQKMGYQIELANIPCRVMAVSTLYSNSGNAFTSVTDPRPR